MAPSGITTGLGPPLWINTASRRSPETYGDRSLFYQQSINSQVPRFNNGSFQSPLLLFGSTRKGTRTRKGKLSKSIIKKFLKNKKVNPLTGKRIKRGGPTYKRFMAAAKRLKKKSHKAGRKSTRKAGFGKSRTKKLSKSKCKMFDETSRDPVSGKKLKSKSKRYKRLIKICRQYDSSSESDSDSESDDDGPSFIIPYSVPRQQPERIVQREYIDNPTQRTEIIEPVSRPASIQRFVDGAPVMEYTPSQPSSVVDTEGNELESRSISVETPQAVGRSGVTTRSMAARSVASSAPASVLSSIMESPVSASPSVRSTMLEYKAQHYIQFNKGNKVKKYCTENDTDSACIRKAYGSLNDDKQYIISTIGPKQVLLANGSSRIVKRPRHVDFMKANYDR
jgi:hypothetical protein